MVNGCLGTLALRFASHLLAQPRRRTRIGKRKEKEKENHAQDIISCKYIPHPQCLNWGVGGSDLWQISHTQPVSGV